MTRKMGEHITVSALNNSNTGYKIFTPDDADCEDVEGENYKKCTFRTPNDVYALNIYMQAAGGGGAAATKGANKSCAYDTKTGNISQSQDCMPVLACTPIFIHKIPCKEVKIEEGIVNFKSIVIGPGGGGGGAVGRIECNNTNNKYLTSAQNGNNGAACVTKYNVGESRSAGVSVSILPYTTNCVGTNCCWRTSDTLNCDNSAGWEYSGCSRVVCTYDAGKNACANYYPAGSWRLPTYAEMGGWANHISEINNGNEGLMLCDAQTIEGASKCSSISGCKGSDSTCFTYALTGGAYSGNYAEYYLEAGKLKGGRDSGSQPQSYRCITTNSTLWGWKAYSGSGGSSGAVSTTNPTNDMDEFIQKYAGNNFHIFARDGYLGAQAIDINQTASYNAQIRETVWDAGIVVRLASGYSNIHGTFGGIGMNTSALTGSLSGLGGELYKPGNAPYYAGNCYNPFSFTDKHGYSCTPGNKGAAGTTNSNLASTGQGGKGGSVSYTLNNTNINCQGGNGGSVSSGYQNGASATCYGGGGGGASSYSNGNGKGGDGGDGYVQISYDIKRQGAPGGGGGGGAQITLREIAVKPNTVYYFYVGKGGVGGLANSDNQNGENGGDTWFEISEADGPGKVIAHGGGGGKIGDDSTLIPTGGKGGEGGKITNAQKAVIKETGKDGEDGNYDETLKLSIGGNGGMAHSSETYNCGGQYKKDDHKLNPATCTNTAANGQSFAYVFETLVQSLLNKSKADAGQGGGGGAYSGAAGMGISGNGGNGTDGYIYIRWNVLKQTLVRGVLFVVLWYKQLAVLVLGYGLRPVCLALWQAVTGSHT